MNLCIQKQDIFCLDTIAIPLAINLQKGISGKPQRRQDYMHLMDGF